MFTVYCLILQDGWLYVGQTSDLMARIQDHRQNRNGRFPTGTFLYVRAHGGIRSITVLGEFVTREEALAFESLATERLNLLGYPTTCTPSRNLDGGAYAPTNAPNLAGGKG